MKIIRYIPKKEEKNGKLKVVAYCRVSTKEKHQKESLNYQIEYYTNLIRTILNIFLLVYSTIMEVVLELKGELGLRRCLN